MATYLITGASGYIGQRLTEQLQKSGHQIYSLARNGIHSDPPWSSDSTNFLRCDLEERDFSQLSGLNVQEGVLIDLAWDFSGRPHQEQVQDYLFLATAVIESGIRRIVSLGTLFELAFNQGEIDEDSPRLGKSEHGLAKALLHDRLVRLCN
jgi:nucleoside-diphosphate-sugar epimerase